MRKLLLLCMFCLTLCLQWPALPVQAAPVTNNGQQVRMRQDLKQVLADRRFNYPDRFAWLKQLFRKISRWLALHQPRHRELKAAWFDNLLKKVGLGLVILLPVVLLCCSRHFIAREQRVKATTANQTDPNTGLTALLEQARRATEAADYRDAIRCFYLAALMQLRARGSLPAGSTGSYSDHENLRLLRQKLGAAALEVQAFNRLVQTFQEKWYGLKSCSLTDCQAAGELFAAIARSNTRKG